MNRLTLLMGAFLIGTVTLMPIQMVYAAVSELDESESFTDEGSLQTNEQLDSQRRSLRQELLNDKAASAKRQAIAKSRQAESAEDKEKRQRLYEESVMERGESVIAERKALKDHRINIDAEKLRGLASSFSK